MDLISNAYTSEEEESDLLSSRVPYSKRFKPEASPSTVFPPNFHSLPQQNEPPIAGRYISKRERAAMDSIHCVSHPNSSSSVSESSVVGSIADSELPCEILLSLKSQRKNRTQSERISNRLSIALNGHLKAVNAVHWSPTQSHLLASASMDHTVIIWNVWGKNLKKARVFNLHNAAVKDVKWSHKGLSILSCGYDNSSRLIDVEKGIQSQVFEEDQVVHVIKFHPDNSNLFLTGGSKGRIRLWDVRARKVMHEYFRGLGPILDFDFILDAKQFIASSDVSSGNASENSIIVWDISRQIPLSNQVYVEAYTCPCVRSHPFDPCFVAQSNGNYIAIFSSVSPFKLDKYKRYDGHAVSGFPIKCNFSLDGEKIASGSSDGNIYFYNYRSSKLIKKIKAYEQACIDVAFHPILPNVIASCSWNGDVTVIE